MLIAVTCLALLQLPATPTPAGYWKLNGDVLDASGNGNDGRVLGAAGQPFSEGKFGLALNSAAGAYVEAPDSASLTRPGSFTLEAWVYANSFPTPDSSTRIVPVIYKEKEYALQLGVSGWPYLMLWGTQGSTFAAFSSWHVPAQSWTHVAFTYARNAAPASGGKITLFLNGAQKASVDTTFVPDTAAGTPLDIGSVPGGARFDGSIDEVRVWNVARSAAEILAAFNQELAGAGQTAPVVKSVVNRASADGRLCPGVLAWVQLDTPPSSVVGVEVGGRAAPVLSNSAGVLEVQIPFELSPGPASLIVQQGEVRSAPFPITLNTAAPGLLPVSYTSPAIPGQVLSLSGVGFGPTAPPAPTGQLTVAPATGRPRLLVGGKEAAVLWFGLDGQTHGSYMLRFRLPTDLPPGSHPVTLAVDSMVSNTVALPVGARVPVIISVVNGASFAGSDMTAPPVRATCVVPGASVTYLPGGRIAGGSLLTLFYENADLQEQLSGFPATDFQGVSVLFNGVAVPLLHIVPSRKQINFLAPATLPDSGFATVQLKTPQGASPERALALEGAMPGIFSLTDPADAARRYALAAFANTAWLAMPPSLARALNIPDACSGGAVSAATLCGQPASPGDVIQIYATGLGRATPGGDAAGQPLPAGSIAPADANPLYQTVQTPVVTIGGIPAEVLFSGLTPGYAGLYQVNARIPDTVPAGDAVPLTIAGRSIPYCDSASIAIRK